MRKICLALGCAALLQATVNDGLDTMYEQHQYDRLKKETALRLAATPRDVRMHLLAGRAALGLDELVEAVGHAKAVIAIDPGNADAYTLIADALIADAKPERAARFQAIASQLKTKSARTNRLDLLLSLGGGYDSNVNSHPGSGRMNEYYVLETVLPPQVGTPQEAFYLQEMLFLNHSYAFSDALELKTQAMLFNKNVIDESDYDSLILSLKSGPKWSFGHAEFWLPLKAATMTYGGNRYSDTYSVEPYYARSFGPYRFSLNAKAERSSYDDAALRVYDYERYGALLGIERSGLYVGYRFFDTSARNESTTLTYTDYTDHGITLKYAFGIVESLKANVQYHYDRKSFDDVTYTASTEKRRDNLNVLKAEANLMLGGDAFINLSARYIDNDSNYLPLDYNRADVLVTYNVLF